MTQSSLQASSMPMTPNLQLTSLSVDQIMVPGEKLLRADNKDEAEPLHKKFDVVPWPSSGRIEGFFHKSNLGMLAIEPRNLLSYGTPLWELPKLFGSDEFFFIISRNEISGYIHYSDLNHPYVKIPVFALIQEAERAIWRWIHSRITEDLLTRLFGDKNAKRMIKRRARIAEQNVEIDWTGVFTLPEILKIGRHCEVISLDDDEIETLRQVRNRVAHSDRSLIGGKAGIKELVDAQELAVQLVRLT